VPKVNIHIKNSTGILQNTAYSKMVICFVCVSYTLTCTHNGAVISVWWWWSGWRCSYGKEEENVYKRM